jgi:hypothetical protein
MCVVVLNYNDLNNQKTVTCNCAASFELEWELRKWSTIITVQTLQHQSSDVTTTVPKYLRVNLRSLYLIYQSNQRKFPTEVNFQKSLFNRPNNLIVTPSCYYGAFNFEFEFNLNNY